ncbi:MAG TPA: hypothetical protein VHX44_16515, partial [Planctomycetota bacterium]|nr:hypothetical protein [Planctomycetota bacterium]
SSDNSVAWALADNYTLLIIIAPELRFAAPFPSADTQLVTIAPGALVVTMPRNSNTRLNQVSGAGGTLAGVITTPETALSDASGRFRYGNSATSSPSDSVDFFTYALTAAGTPNRQLGYVHLTLINISDAATTVGGAYVTLTNASNGAKISGATLSFGISESDAKPFSEMANGVYRYLISNTEVGFIRIRAAGFQDYTDAV